MFSYIWPVALIVLSNIFYHITAKSTPEGMDPFASLTITYTVGALISLILFFALSRGGSLTREFSKINWATIVLGVVIVGLEAGNIFAYRAGWPISVASIIENALLAVVLIFVGWLLYKEALTWNKIVGIIICLAGLALINKN